MFSAYTPIIEVFPSCLVTWQFTFFTFLPDLQTEEKPPATRRKSAYMRIIGGFIFGLVNCQVTFAADSKIVP